MDDSSSRRTMLQRFAALAGVGALAAASSPAKSAGEKTMRHETLVIDVAVLGHTNYDNESGAANLHPDYVNRVKGKSRDGFLKSDTRGSMFYFEGVIYPGGTIPDPSADDPDGVIWDFPKEPMGTFFDRGWVVINNKSDGPYVARPDPHLLSHADYYLGGIVGPDNLTPTDMIATVGLENGTPPNDVVTRAVVGGTGRYATASGQVVQRRVGRNTTPIRGLDLPYGFEPPSPNYRLTFDLYMLDS